MSLTLEQKQAVVAEVSEVVANAQTAIAAEYLGLTVAEMTDLRVKAREAGVYVRVVKNSLAKRAFEGTPFECMNEAMVGPLMLLSTEDPGAGARVIRDFTKENEKLVTKAIGFDGNLLPPEDLKAIASLPTLEEARASLLGILQAPASQLVRTLAEPGGQLVRVLNAYSTQQAA